jgi:hypothetical protein
MPNSGLQMHLKNSPAPASPRERNGPAFSPPFVRKCLNLSGRLHKMGKIKRGLIFVCTYFFAGTFVAFFSSFDGKFWSRHGGKPRARFRRESSGFLTLHRDQKDSILPGNAMSIILGKLHARIQNPRALKERDQRS